MKLLQFKKKVVQELGIIKAVLSLDIGKHHLRYIQ
jgi:hypothetical protein